MLILNETAAARSAFELTKLALEHGKFDFFSEDNPVARAEKVFEFYETLCNRFAGKKD